MSATPRPWRVAAEQGSKLLGYAVLGGTTPEKREGVASMWVSDGLPHAKENAELIVQRVNAFDALLAVAKAADQRVHSPLHPWRREVSDALTALDAAHPDWRTWA